MNLGECFRRHAYRMSAQIVLISLLPLVNAEIFWVERLSSDLFSRDPPSKGATSEVSATDILNDMRSNMRLPGETFLPTGSCPSQTNPHISCRPRHQCPLSEIHKPLRPCSLSSRSLFGRSLAHNEFPESQVGFTGICCLNASSVTTKTPKRPRIAVTRRLTTGSTTKSPVPYFASISQSEEYLQSVLTADRIPDPVEIARQPVNVTADLDVVEYAPPTKLSDLILPGSESFWKARPWHPMDFREANMADLGLDCGKRDLGHHMIRVGRIVGGETASFSDWPWMVMILNYGRPRCGGTLISQRIVITAAHCVSGNLLLYSLTVKIGMFNTNERQTLPFPPVMMGIERIFRHPFFDLSTLLNDIAILHLKEPVTFGPNIQPACLASHEYPASTPTYILGWGKEEENNTVYDLPDTLQSVMVPIINRTKCAKYFAAQGLANLIGQQHLCAGSEQGGRDACQGDSGGPMLKENPDGRFELTGVISWGFGCGEPNVPGVYTNIHFYKRWIIDTIRNIELFSS